MRPRFLMVKERGVIVKILPEEIVYIKAEGNYSFIHTVHGKQYVVSRGIGVMKEQFALLGCFPQVYRSFIVNITYVRSFSRNEGVRLSAPFDKDFSIPLSAEGERELMSYSV